MCFYDFGRLFRVIIPFASLSVFYTTLLVYSVKGTPIYEPLGCYADSGRHPRPLPRLLRSFRSSMNWNEMETAIELCANESLKKGFRYFGLQDFGDCWSGDTADQSYERDGISTNCVRGVGKANANFVYKFFEYQQQVPGCNASWNAKDQNCYQLQSNIGLTASEAEEHCKNLGSSLVLTADNSLYQSIELLIKTLEITGKLNQTECILLGDGDISYNGTLQQWNDSLNVTLPTFNKAALNDSYSCVVKASNGRWYHHMCHIQRCDFLCTQRREILPLPGTFEQKEVGFSLRNHVIVRMIVVDVVECAHECLLSRFCRSFNYRYTNPSNSYRYYGYPAGGFLCELNEASGEHARKELRRHAHYKYYERVRMRQCHISEGRMRLNK